MPPRQQFGQAELDMVTQVFQDSWEKGVDFGYQDDWENRYTDTFCRFQGGGFADAVCSGTAAVYLALQALDIKPGCEVMVSPVTDPGSISAVVLQGYRIRVADAEPDSFNIGPDQFEAALTDETRAAVLTHMGGIPLDIEPIRQIAPKRGILLVEDCSQAHGARIRGKRVGGFGQTAAFGCDEWMDRICESMQARGSRVGDPYEVLIRRGNTESIRRSGDGFSSYPERWDSRSEDRHEVIRG